MDIMHLTPRTVKAVSKSKKKTKKHKAAQAKLQKQGKTEDGEQYALTALDVYSLKGFVVPVNDLETETIETAIRRHVVVRGVAAEFVFDGGPEFKAQVKAGAKAYDATVHQTTPNHSKSLGIVERVNRTIQRTLAHVIGGRGV